MKNVSKDMETFHRKVSLTLPQGLLAEQVRDWKRDMSMIIRPIVVITTISREGVPNAALKTNFMIVSSLEEVAFACSPEHDTYRNIVETGEFVVNVPPEEIIEKIMATAVDFPHNVNEIEKAGLTAIPSEKVKPPRIKECKLHFECKLKWYKDNIFVGSVVSASADEDLIEGSVEERQRKLQQIFLVGAKMYGKIGEIKELPLDIIKRYKR
ncbi:MAG: flavin reductase family protein [Candidatus Baldrarchaeia archaeon]